MTVRKMSISMPEEIAELIRDAAEENGQSVSSWATEAFEEKLRAAAWRKQAEESSRELIIAYEAEHGPIPEHDREAALEFMRGVGLLGDAHVAKAG
ncbi:metal-responsive CopG/Arc/MetJ family transcriptional regulator [Nocardiopsis mwathae]|uniref:Metal-responsive CopG/Arc/MetJ family transcriptional regulator n=1 Tax=Nocardiopsis mwathae TaxID=1472723 RepID=A0A7W9YFJ2_9ACTN|nr:Arc family DNA-binding protein [Nocardiopsis mwathae]MBB6171157.1 metal-responsive CopG/Arc/MetJ family transcriptional regulator [Nocardiopsis mwathae]